MRQTFTSGNVSWTRGAHRRQYGRDLPVGGRLISRGEDGGGPAHGAPGATARWNGAGVIHTEFRARISPVRSDAYDDLPRYNGRKPGPRRRASAVGTEQRRTSSKRAM